MRKTILILAAACLWGLLAPLAIAKDRSADLERAHSSGRPKTDSIARTAELLETRSVSKGHWAANEVDLQSERIEFDLEKSVLQRSEVILTLCLKMIYKNLELITDLRVLRQNGYNHEF